MFSKVHKMSYLIGTCIMSKCESCGYFISNHTLTSKLEVKSWQAIWEINRMLQVLNQTPNICLPFNDFLVLLIQTIWQSPSTVSKCRIHPLICTIHTVTRTKMFATEGLRCHYSLLSCLQTIFFFTAAWLCWCWWHWLLWW